MQQRPEFRSSGDTWADTTTLTGRALRPGVHRYVADLERDIRTFIDATNTAPKPFLWVKPADLDPLCGSSPASVKRFCLRTLGAATADEALSRTSESGHWKRHKAGGNEAMIAPLHHNPNLDAWTTPLHQLDPANPARFQDGTMWHYFARLRRDAPVHYSITSPLFGPYWSVVKYKDIMQVEVNHKVFSSDSRFGGISIGGISIRDRPNQLQLPMFIAMDPPRHGDQRKVVQPIFAPGNLAKLKHTILGRVCTILDELPRGETFNWVEHVSIELTVQMLATLFDFPFEDRRKLSFWSDCATAVPEAGGFIDSEAKREQVFAECLAYFTNLWNERVNAEPRRDLVSILAHGESTRNMTPREYLGNLILLIVGGNDTTRNSISGGPLFLSQNPEEYAKLRANPALIKSMVPEIIRYQTPIAHMRRTAVADFELGGQKIRAGDKVVMWYISGNRDEEAIEEPERFIIDRKRPRQHLSFGFGIHRCVGNRLAELQLKILWEEIMQRFPKIEVMGPPKRVFSSFVHGITDLPVRIPA